MIAIGRIKRAHGVKGFVKFTLYNNVSPERLERLERILLIPPQGRGGRERYLEVEAFRPMGKTQAFKFRGVDSPEEARVLGGGEIWCDERFASPREEGEFYFNELRGCKLYDGELCIGEVSSVVEGGGGELIEVSLSVSGKSVLIPFNEHFIDEVTPEKFRITLQPRLEERWLFNG